jgi:hypothetical protein
MARKRQEPSGQQSALDAAISTQQARQAPEPTKRTNPPPNPEKYGYKADGTPRRSHAGPGRGHTKPNGMGRGMGLDLLKEFVKVNQGELEVYSHEGYALIRAGQERFLDRPTFFEGTVVSITFKCDESYYHLASEAQEDKLF